MKKIDYVYHFASLAGIPDCNKNPRKAVGINIQGTLNILEASRLNNVKKNITTLIMKKQITSIINLKLLLHVLFTEI